MDNNECVVTFKNANRNVSMYFTIIDGDLDMQMGINPEVKEGEEPDLPLMLASTFLKALNIENEDEHGSEKSIIVS